ncbi:MAG: acetoacetate--CoA ligase, partial [Planctomycetota bacterium]
WDSIAQYFEIQWKKPYEQVVDNPKKMPGAKWFTGGELNFSENLLAKGEEGDIAILSYDESGKREEISFGELRGQVGSLIQGLENLGVKPGDRVAAYMPNISETVIAMLAATALGAVWSSCSPDFGFQGVLDRFGQIEPKILFTTPGYLFKGKWISIQDKVNQIIKAIPSLEKVILVPYRHDHGNSLPEGDNLVSWQSLLENPKEPKYQYFSFQHPVYIMYSSGTTGLPKCIVQGPGVFLNHFKELSLHCDLKKGDRIFYFTTCGWMMWNWLASSLGLGATIVLYDGSPFAHGPETLWKMAEETQLKIFGTSAGYLHALKDAEYTPSSLNLNNLSTILSTGAPLSKEGFEYVYDKIKRDLQLSSISGGTDLNGCWALGCPLLPVYSGELQCRGLGMDVDVLDEKGNSLRNQPGELVCKSAFPSMPLYFWKDEDGQKYHQAYFAYYPGIWRHGDFAELTDRGTMIIYGRSDATLNPGGVRMGTAEFYRVLENLEEIRDSVVVGLPIEGEEKILVFLQLKEGLDWTEYLEEKIRKEIKEKLSPRHKPWKILPVPEIPYTLNMKKVELAIKNI